jgi:hypothetical protein
VAESLSGSTFGTGSAVHVRCVKLCGLAAIHARPARVLGSIGERRHVRADNELSHLQTLAPVDAAANTA